MKKYKLEIIVLLTSAAIMILELTASRILGPHVGTSNIIWTSIIGIILASMAIGYYLGGCLADKKPSIPILIKILLITAISISIIPLLEVLIVEPISNKINNLKIVSIISSIILFTIPSCLLAMVYPYCLKLKEASKENIGKTSGKLSFNSTIGSIIGTFLTGFVLLPYLGNKKIILLTSLLLLLIAFVIKEKKNLKFIGIIILLIVLSFGSYYCSDKIFKKVRYDVIADIDTEYNRVLITNFKNSEGIDQLQLEVGKTRQSFIDRSNQNGAYKYFDYFDLFPYFNSKAYDTLLIGGGAYIYPTRFASKFPDKTMDVVEIDGKFIDIAQKYFNYEEKENIKTYAQDGRGYLNKNNKKYDVIFTDAYKEMIAPYELTTKESLTKMKESLNDNGIVVTNLMGTLKGEKSLFFQAEYKTFKEVFKNVIVMSESLYNDRVGFIVLIGFKDDNEIDINPTKNVLFNNIIEDIKIDKNIKILTDDYAPVEYYISKY